jgi:hypothetical protein
MHFNSSQSHRVDSTATRTRRTAIRALMLWAAIAALSFLTTHAAAQGCILARSPEQSGITGQGGLLEPGHFQITFSERHQYSYQHYVGDVYQEYRGQLGNEVVNKINLVITNLTYQWTPRISFEIDAPWLFASRKSQNSPIEYQSSGLGDTIIGGSIWIRNPQKAPRDNFSVGLGLFIPSGNDDLTNTVNTNTTGVGAPVEATLPVDYSIQPGEGGWGLEMQWAGYRFLGKNLTLYTDGSYIATQGGTDGVQRSATLSTTTPLTNYNAIADQYLMEGGTAFPVNHRVKGLSATLAVRDEGVPAYNLFPNSNAGFRRPGFAVTAGPGGEYTRGANTLTAGLYKAIHRDRTSSYPDSVYGTHGDAAFAQYVWLASLTHNF